jgi:hypothetical protein
MSRKKCARLPAEIKKTQDRIEHWRRTRRRRSPMPEDLWKEASALARKHGVYPISRDLRLSYDSLKKRSLQPARRDLKPQGSHSEGFVELSAAQVMDTVNGAADPQRAIELADSNGARLTIRLADHDRFDVVGLVRAFWNRSR